MVDTVDKIEPESWRDKQGVHVKLDFPELTEDKSVPQVWKEGNAYHVRLDFDFTEKEVAEQYQLLADETERAVEERIEKEAALYFINRKTYREIAQEYGVSKSQVGKDIARFSVKISKTINSSPSINRQSSILFAELLAQGDFRIKALYEQYEGLMHQEQVLGAGLMRVVERLKANPDARINLQAQKEACREIRSINAQKISIGGQLRAESVERREIYATFGLCGTYDAAELNRPGDDAWCAQRVEEIENYVRSIHRIFSEEMSNKDEMNRVIERLLQERKEFVERQNQECRC